MIVQSELHAFRYKTLTVLYPSRLRWRCIRCGNSCRDSGNKDRKVRMLPYEVHLIADKLGLRTVDFTIESDDSVYCFEMKKKENGSCYFLDGVSCRVYDERPLVCRFYPFYLIQPRIGHIIFGFDPYCNGIGRGPVLKTRFFIRLLELALEALDRNRSAVKPYSSGRSFSDSLKRGACDLHYA